MDEFPGNSRRAVDRSQKPEPVEPEKVKLDKVVTGIVVRRKKPLGRRLRETFFVGDGVLGYLGKEVLLPALQNLLIDGVTQGIEKAVYGEVRTQRGMSYQGSPASRTHISYNRPSSIIRQSEPTAPARRVVAQPSAFNIGEVVVESKIEAQVIYDKLVETVEEYGAATVAHFNDLIGQTSAWTDHKYGWTDLEKFRIVRVREGWLIELPDPEDLR